MNEWAIRILCAPSPLYYILRSHSAFALLFFLQYVDNIQLLFLFSCFSVVMSVTFVINGSACASIGINTVLPDRVYFSANTWARLDNAGSTFVALPSLICKFRAQNSNLILKFEFPLKKAHDAWWILVSWGMMDPLANFKYVFADFGHVWLCV